MKGKPTPKKAPTQIKAQFAQTISEQFVSTALLLNEVSEKSREIWNEVSENCSEICPEILPEISRAFLAGRNVLPPKTSQHFSRRRFQISNRIPNQISPKTSLTHFCRLGSPNSLYNCPPFSFKIGKKRAERVCPLVAWYSAILRYCNYSCYTPPIARYPSEGSLTCDPLLMLFCMQAKCQCDGCLYGGYSAIGCYTWKTKRNRV